MDSMKKTIFIFTLISLVGFFYWRSAVTDDSLVQVMTTKVANQSISKSLIASGVIAFRHDVELKSEVTGKVTQIQVSEGEQVEKGKVLLTIDPEISEAEVDKANANVKIEEINIERQALEVANNEKKWQRKQRLYEKGLINKEEFDDLTNQLNSSRLNLKSSQGALLRAQAELDKAKDSLEKTIVRSPISGIVTNIAINVGETAYAGGGQTGSGTLLIKVADPSEILAKVDIEERDIGKIKVGQQANIRLVAFPRRLLTGGIESITTSIQTPDKQQGLTFQAKILLTKNDALSEQFEGIRPGMSSRAEIQILHKPSVIAIPVDAIQYDLSLEQTIASSDSSENSAYVFVVSNGVIEKKNLKLGISDTFFHEVLSGLAKDDQVVSGPYDILQDIQVGQKVALTPENAESENIQAGNVQASNMEMSLAE
jgi:HlyD family secretion protein